jgi:tRNA (cytidine56-2'-O)-methyltransferase
MITVLRLGHRPLRDKRITTHIVLVARAFGVNEVVISTSDKELQKRIGKINLKFGGSSFTVRTGINWRKYINSWDGYIVHLTMYGIHIDDALPKIPYGEKILIIVGAEKVPSEIYKLADMNIAIGNQPHSEVAALAVFLDRYTAGRCLHTAFKDAKYMIVPAEREKKIKFVYPTEKECINILKKAGCESDVIEHSIAVKKLALKLAKMCNADIKFISAGALLHDIGRAKTHSVFHGIEGGKILKKLHMSKELIKIAECHLGAGIPGDEAVKAGLPPKDYLPITLE